MRTEQIGKLDVLFIVPPHFRLAGERFFHFPLGLGYLVSSLKKKYFASAIFNMDAMKTVSFYMRVLNKLNPWHQYRWYRYAKRWDLYYRRIEDASDNIWSEVEIVLKKTNPKIVGITTSIVSIPSVINITRIIKKIDPDIKVVLGGPAATTIPDYLLSNENVDYLVHGEGEETMAELAEHILADDIAFDAIQCVNGISLRNGDTIVRTPARKLIKVLDELPFPDRDSMFSLNDNGQIQKVYSSGDILTSRGCPYFCKFCACHTIWGDRNPRNRSVNNIVQELEFVIDKFGQRTFLLWDDCFTVDKERVIEFCEEVIKRNLNIEWVCLARLNNLDRQMVDAMKRAGCVQLQVGVESGSDRILKFIGKNLSLSLIHEKAKMLNDAEMNWLAFFIIGFPTETKDEIEQTLKYIKMINPSFVGISIFSPYPGTEFYSYLSKKKLFYTQADYLKNDTWYSKNNYTGTMSDEEFSSIALKALKYGDKHNKKRRK